MGTHGMMFHHFHDNKKHIAEQGSVSQEDFENILDYYAERYNLIGADEYCYKAQHDDLQYKDVCVTFDDNLLCQYDIAMPVLNKRKLPAFFFAYTSPIQGKAEKLEIYRHFRHLMFTDIDEFYKAFFAIYEDRKKELSIDFNIENGFDASTYLVQYSFYSLNDRKFRYYREEVLGQSQYYKIMDFMLEKYNYDIQYYAKNLWSGNMQIRDLGNNGHLVGLHSHTHPTCLGKYDYNDQLNEYSTCKEILEDCLGTKVISASYPCGSVNEDTEQIMKKLGIEIAFKESMIPYKSKLMIPREDHSNIIKEMKKDENNSIHKQQTKTPVSD